MKYILPIISNFHKIISTVSKYSNHLPPHSKYRLSIWLIFETIIHKPSSQLPNRKVSRRVQHLIERQVSLFAGYMVLFAHDDAVDKFNLDSKQIYEQLSRYLSAFLLGFSMDKEELNVEKLTQEMNKWSFKLSKLLSDSPHILMELCCLLSIPSNLYNLPLKDKITIQNLLFKDEYEELCRDWLNTSIVSAMGMGQAFHKILILLKESLDEDDVIQQRRSEFFMGLLVKCMYGQAHSPEQKNLDLLSYERFIEISCLKSTILFDIYNYVSDQVNEKRFFDTRHNSSRACEQFFDDLQDYEEDTVDQTLSILHMHILEQSKLAEKYLSISKGKNITTDIIKELISETKILNITYNGMFIYHNPFIRATRDPSGNLCVRPEDSETILREIWVNSPSEVSWPIDRLARHRLWLGSCLKDAWQSKKYSAVLDIIYKSNFPIALLKSFSYFVHNNKKVNINAYSQHGALKSGYSSYFALKLGLKALYVKYWTKRMLHIFTASVGFGA